MNLSDLAGALSRRGARDVELYTKQGRSHRVMWGAQGPTEIRSREAGWAVRATGARGSLFSCGTGSPERGAWFPALAGAPLQLPLGRDGDALDFDPSLDLPLLSKGPASDCLSRFRETLLRDCPGARISQLVLDDGASEARLQSSLGIDCAQRNRAGGLFVEVAAGSGGEARYSAQFAARAAGQFDFEALARRIATILIVRKTGEICASGSGSMVFAPGVATRLLAGLLPALLGSAGRSAARPLLDRSSHLGSPAVTVIDDGRLAGGVLCSATDGEGLPTREVLLIEEGVYRQPILSWEEAEPGRGFASGCKSRPSWRDAPKLAPSHLYLLPDLDTSPHDLLNSVSSGYYWLDAAGGTFDLAQDRFTLEVAGLRLDQGQATEPIAVARLAGSVHDLWNGVTGVGRDLAFSSSGALIGAPSLLVEGLEWG